MTPESSSSAAVPRARPFPRFCDRCRTRTVYAATVPYVTEVGYEGRTYQVDTPCLEVPRCRTCGELYFDNDAESQVSRAFRGEARLLQPEQIRSNRIALGLTSEGLAARLGTAREDLEAWEDGLFVQSRAVDNLLRAFFALPEVRTALAGANQSPTFGVVIGGLPAASGS